MGICQNWSKDCICVHTLFEDRYHCSSARKRESSTARQRAGELSRAAQSGKALPHGKGRESSPQLHRRESSAEWQRAGELPRAAEGGRALPHGKGWRALPTGRRRESSTARQKSDIALLVGTMRESSPERHRAGELSRAAKGGRTLPHSNGRESSPGRHKAGELS